jgi:hypothetical protein
VPLVLVLVGCSSTTPPAVPEPIVGEPAPLAAAPEREPAPEPPPSVEPEPEPEPEPALADPRDSPPPGFVPIPEKRKGGFPGLEFAEVRAFAFDLRVDGRPICMGPLDDDGSLCSTVVGDGVVLSSEQTDLLLAIVRAKGTYGDGSACFLPHHGFVFYDAAGVPVAELSLCFMCEMMRSSPAIPSGKRSAESGSEYGLSPKATGLLRLLCNDLGLPRCDARNPGEFGP